MAGWPPLKRREFIRRLRALGFTGPYSGTRHQFLVSGSCRQTIPTNSEYSTPQIRMLVRQVEAIIERKITPEDWAKL